MFTSIYVLVNKAESYIYYWPFIPMTFVMWIVHNKLVKDPILYSIDVYANAIKKSQLTGMELIKVGLLPTNKDLEKISKYSRPLQQNIYSGIFQGLKHLTFSTTEYIPMAYQKTVELVRLAADETSLSY